MWGENYPPFAGLFFSSSLLIILLRSLSYTKSSISYISCISYIFTPSFFSYLIVHNYALEKLTNATLCFRRVARNFIKYSYTGERLVQWTKLIYVTVQFCKTRKVIRVLNHETDRRRWAVRKRADWYITSFTKSLNKQAGFQQFEEQHR